MSQIVKLDQAAHQLHELVLSLKPGDEIILTQDDKPVGRLTLPPAEQGERKERQFGLGKDKLRIIRESDAHLEGFKEYM